MTKTTLVRVLVALLVVLVLGAASVIIVSNNAGATARTAETPTGFLH
jgi:hypothetical protein